jgi:hypothetical protein
MASYREPDPSDLEKSREARIARQNLVRHEQYVSALRRAERLRSDSGRPASSELTELISSGTTELNAVKQRAGGRIYPRRRPTNKHPTSNCQVFLDECGSHSLAELGPFKVFVLSAVIIRDADHPTIDTEWRKFKGASLGSPDTIVHEPDVRKGEGPFRDPNRQGKLTAMARVVSSLDFVALAVVVHRPNYKRDFGTGPVDESLPTHIYWMALDFLMERTVMALDTHFNGARAQVIAESRGPKEDASLQYEFARLHLDGTSYVADGWFRHALCPGISFQSKKVNSTGLQLADLLARPVGEKVIDSTSYPYLWPEFRGKLCQGHETKNSILGLKIMPWRERYKDLWKS